MKPGLARLLNLIFALLVLAGCATPDSRPERGEEAPAEELRVATLLAQFSQWQGVSADTLRPTLAQAQAEFERAPGLEQRLRLALLFSLPRVPWREDVRVVSLLGGINDARGAPGSPLRNLALLLHTQASERLRQQKNEQRRHEAQLREEQNLVEDLKQKLDALRKIDKDVIKKKRSAT